MTVAGAGERSCACRSFVLPVDHVKKERPHAVQTPHVPHLLQALYNSVPFFYLFFTISRAPVNFPAAWMRPNSSHREISARRSTSGPASCSAKSTFARLQGCTQSQNSTFFFRGGLRFSTVHAPSHMTSFPFRYAVRFFEICRSACIWRDLLNHLIPMKIPNQPLSPAPDPWHI